MFFGQLPETGEEVRIPEIEPLVMRNFLRYFHRFNNFALRCCKSKNNVAKTFFLFKVHKSLRKYITAQVKHLHTILLSKALLQNYSKILPKHYIIN